MPCNFIAFLFRNAATGKEVTVVAREVYRAVFYAFLTLLTNFSVISYFLTFYKVYFLHRRKVDIARLTK